MPIASRTLYCGCVSIKYPCNNCIMCPEHCTCKMCPECITSFHESEICSKCNKCTESGCCTCVTCRGCKTKFENRVSDEICRNCFRCNNCCKCFACKHPDCIVNLKRVVNTITSSDFGKLFHGSCGKCKEHCKCGVCRQGSKTHYVFHLDICRICLICTEHCSCVPCPTCARRTPPNHLHATTSFGFVGEVPCGNCAHCCKCNTTGVDFRKGKFMLFSSVYAQGLFKRNKLRRHLSCELEVDIFNKSVRSVAINTALAKWQDAVVQDGSVPNGFEINMNPTNGDLFLQHVKELTDGLAVLKAGCTDACGLHVHVNVKGTPLIKPDGAPELDSKGLQVFDPRTAYTHYDLRRLIMLYYKVERALFELCAPRRLDAKYSKICGRYYMDNKSDNPKQFRQNSTSKLYNDSAPLEIPSQRREEPARLARSIASISNGRVSPSSVSRFSQIGSQIKERKHHKYQPIRYKALNLHSFFMRGTIEFRHKEGSVDYNEITSWALVCGHLVDSAAALSDAQINGLPDNPREALLRVIPATLHEYCQSKWALDINTIIRCKQAADYLWAAQRLQPMEVTQCAE